MAKTRAQTNRAIRQEELRGRLAAQGHEQHVVELLGKIQELSNELTPLELKRLEVVISTKLALLKKYIPDLKATELSGPDGEPLPAEIVIQHVKVSDRKP